MKQDEVAPFVDKCVAVYLESGDIFQGFLRTTDTGYEVDAGSSQTSIESPEAIDYIEFLKM
jgi:hypothetical protein